MGTTAPSRAGFNELVGVPAGGQRPGLGFTVADDARDEQVGVVERGAVRVHEGVAELAALVDGAGRLGSDVARDAAGEGELPEQSAQAFRVLRDVRVGLGVGALGVGVRDQAGAAVARGGTPVPEQTRLDVLGGQRLTQQRVVQQVDLPLASTRCARARRSPTVMPSSCGPSKVVAIGHECMPSESGEDGARWRLTAAAPAWRAPP